MCEQANDRIALRYVMNPGVKVQIRGSICDANQEIKQLQKDVTKLNDRYVQFYDSTLAQSKNKIAKIEEDANDLFLFQQAQDLLADVKACDGVDQELRERVEELLQYIDRAAVKKASGPSPTWEKKAEEMEARDNLLSEAKAEYISEKTALTRRLFRFKCAREHLQELLD